MQVEQLENPIAKSQELVLAGATSVNVPDVLQRNLVPAEMVPFPSAKPRSVRYSPRLSFVPATEAMRTKTQRMRDFIIEWEEKCLKGVSLVLRLIH